MYIIRIKLIIYTCILSKYLLIILRSLVCSSKFRVILAQVFLFEDLYTAIANFLSVERDQQSQYCNTEIKCNKRNRIKQNKDKIRKSLTHSNSWK